MWEVEALVCGSPLHVAMMFTEESQDSTQVPFRFIMALPLSSKKKGYLTDNPNTLTMDLVNIQRSPLFPPLHITPKQKINHSAHSRKKHHYNRKRNMLGMGPNKKTAGQTLKE